MMEVFQEQTEKFYRNMAVSQGSDSMSPSPLNRSRTHSQSQGLEVQSVKSIFKSKADSAPIGLKKQASTFQNESMLD